MRSVGVIRVLVLCGGLCAPAAAQMELHGFVEPCTVANAQESATKCEQCTVLAEDPQACSRRLARLGYQKKCRTHGESATKWAEVWCAPKSAPPPEPAEPSKAVALVVGSVVLLGAWLYSKRGRRSAPPK